MGGNQVAIKRLKKEHDEIEKAKAELPFTVHPLEDNFLEWHFTLQGPTDSPFEHGLYHGRLIFPADYPFSAPNLMFVTASGRFQTNTKICLTVTGFHPEHWQPAWGVRTMLIAIRDHFTVEDNGAIGYLGYSKEDRTQLAAASRTASCKACKYQPPELPLLERTELAQTIAATSIRRPSEEAPNEYHVVQLVALVLVALSAIALTYFVKF